MIFSGKYSLIIKRSLLLQTDLVLKSIFSPFISRKMRKRAPSDNRDVSNVFKQELFCLVSKPTNGMDY